MKNRIKLSKSSAEIVASLDDLLTEILLRLPLKSLIRSKLVSKHWQSLITGPGFCILRNPNPNPALGLFVPNTNFRVNPWYEYVPFSDDESNNPPFTKLKFTKDRAGIKILQLVTGFCYAAVLGPVIVTGDTTFTIPSPTNFQTFQN
ncbi:hypothetical protein BUALT_Bualt01G0062700 [Buddleja alternifolia]|uniref:F-box domain-containing protein n=1 Tax=Buddleja alternifolia TaxID=168488 RepID=A0AAV6YFE3_9LAMI|nr:hypothetical protein BUALT_Bualt01G0062700 [Buddleja alternifolia]